MVTQPEAIAREYRDVFYEALAGGSAAIGDADPLTILTRTIEGAFAAAQGDSPAWAALAELRQVAAKSSLEEAVESAQNRYPSSGAFAEAIYFTRCLVRDAAPTLSLLETRRYLEDAFVPPTLVELATDRTAVLDATTFALLWRDASRLDWMLSTAAIWRRDYARLFQTRHASFHAGLSVAVELIDAAGSAAAALDRLNSLPRLGPPLGLAAVMSYHQFERVFPCQADAATLVADLQLAPRCHACDFALGGEAPMQEARRIVGAIERALVSQQTRLARKVIGRILERPAARGDDRLSRFISVVQASDLAGFVQVLDAPLIDFLRDLLEGRNTERSLFSRLAEAYPVVTASNLEATIAEFRRLAYESLARGEDVRLRDEEPA